jgi:DNA-directed RNA polymerase subunit E"
MEGEKVCKKCRRFVRGKVCPACNIANFTKTWKGVVIIHDPNNSDVAKALGITAPGKYALWVKE